MAELSGGKALEAKLAEIATALGTGDRALRVGFLEKATYPTGSSAAARKRARKQARKAQFQAAKAKAGASGGTTVATVAAANEFGDPANGRPPRPFFRGMIKEKSKNWGKSLAGVLKANNYDVDKSLGLMGEGIKGQLQESIIKLVAPPLKQATIDRKGFAKPLIDTSHMLNSVDYDVK
jgi:hypothetical protein